MSDEEQRRRFGRKRAAGCRCEYNFTCGTCLEAAGPTPGPEDGKRDHEDRVDELRERGRLG